MKKPKYIYTEYSDGSLFEYYGFKPYIDARAEVFIDKLNGKEDILEEYIKFNLDVEFREEFINKYDFDYYVVSSGNFDLIDYLINYNDINITAPFAGLAGIPEFVWGLFLTAFAVLPIIYFATSNKRK